MLEQSPIEISKKDDTTCVMTIRQDDYSKAMNNRLSKIQDLASKYENVAYPEKIDDYTFDLKHVYGEIADTYIKNKQKEGVYYIWTTKILPKVKEIKNTIEKNENILIMDQHQKNIMYDLDNENVYLLNLMQMQEKL